MTSLIFGEVIIDCVQPDKSKLLFEPVNGGSPYNVALALARLEQPVDLCSSISTDVFGKTVVTTCDDEGIGRALVQLVDQPSTLAMVHSDPDGNVSYSFYLSATSIEAFSWTKVQLDDKYDHIHPGSYVALHQNLAEDCVAFVRQHCDNRLVTFDPNIRLSLTPDPDALRPLVETYAALSGCIKASDEDLEILYPNMSAANAARHLLSKGAELVIVTLGAKGSMAIHTNGTQVRLDADIPSQIGDTVGAGDSFMAGCFWQLRQNNWMSRVALAQLNSDDLTRLLSQAGGVASYNCRFFGCNPPKLRDLIE